MDGVIIIVPLTQGKHALIDLEDWDKIRPYKWSTWETTGGVYAHTLSGKKRIIMHHLILPRIVSYVIDHRDRNGLNNLRTNLRYATYAENARNKCKSYRNTSGYKGVSWEKRRQKWEANIKVNYVKHFLGYYAVKEEAALAYNEAAKSFHGEFASLNEVIQ